LIRFSCAAALLALLAAPRAHADDASHLAAAKHLLNMMNMAELMDQTVVQAIDAQVKGNPQMSPYRETMLAFFRKYASWEQIEGDVTKSYVENFSEAELSEVTQFYKTPTGKKVLQRMPALMAQGAQIGQQRVQAHLPELMQMIQAQDEKLRKAAADEAAKAAPPPAPAKGQ
jgi:hypothetical protein